ncbi:hypothetical protein NX862_14625 [Rhodobacter sp. KR11]|jgi:hypothetical protein|uniref:hypothetical protein n=1 Tax=Rhodobacter sp. KR11 TaxID=2974588 RepID=UPI002221CD33|nr:hypothetical protein [Rhodobacter sp. KR11]MCW1919992.1 hypothetical protein [Rhodobacter sp. KR11]
MRGWVALCLTLALALPAGAEAKWVTPAGKPLTLDSCSAYRSATSGGATVCYARRITKAPADLAACAADGGTPRLSDTMAPVFTCSFPRLDAGKACTKSTDCELACDALTRECRAFSAMGQILDKTGRSVQVVN